MDACRNYADKTGRRLTFEYSLVGGVNDTKEDAEELIGLAAPLGSHVNLIPVNPIKERDLYSPTMPRLQRSRSVWKKAASTSQSVVRWEGTSTGRADSCAADTWKSRASEPSRKRTMPDNSLSFCIFVLVW